MPRYPRSQDVRLETQRPLSVRRTRKPQHTFALSFRPWQFQPCCLVPVLPGETLKSANIQARVMTDPVASPLQGWWCEFYLFNVRIGDLHQGYDQTFRAIFEDVGAISASEPAKDSDYYAGGWTGQSINIVDKCVWSIMRAYFRKEDEEADAVTIDDVYAVRACGATGFDSVTPDDQIIKPGADPFTNPDTSIVDPPADAWQTNWEAFQSMRESKLTTTTFEEYLAQMGVSTPPKLVETVTDFRKPELVRFVRDFAFPRTTVNQDTGAIVSTLEWSLAERVDKRRFFSEPGFLIGACVVRPKVYFREQVGSLANWHCTETVGWPRPEWETDPHMSLQYYNDDAQAPFPGGTARPFWLDRRDMWIHGDQFVNFSTTAPQAGQGVYWQAVNLPTVGNTVYPTLADVQRIFADNKTDGTGVKQWVHADGILNLRIASRLGVSDTTN